MTSNFFSRFKKNSPQPGVEPITIVSGLPRSGTSMMMKMLEAGGLPILTDYIRSADESNPKGYYEFERVKKLKDGDFEWLGTAPGHAVKVISALLEYLPNQYSYRVIFMQRNMTEILASQRQMLMLRGEPADTISDEAMAALFNQHLEQVTGWIVRQPNFKVLFVTYNDILNNPDSIVSKVAEFLGGPLDTLAMKQTIDQRLYRQRQQPPTGNC